MITITLVILAMHPILGQLCSLWTGRSKMGIAPKY